MQTQATAITGTQLDANDLGPLAWVLDELRKSLDGASKALRRFVRDAELARGSDLAELDASQLRIARQQLHQAVGALEMVGLGAPAKVLRAMEALAQKFVQRPELCSDDAANKVERANFALTEYLEGVLKGRNASAVALFPQYRDVMDLVGGDRVHPADLWSQEWRWIDVPLAPSAPLQFDPSVRARVDMAVLKVVRSGDAAAATTMSDISLGLAGAAGALEARVFWKISAAFFEAVHLGLCPSDVFVKRTASRVIAQYMTLARGETGVVDRLALDLLFYCAQAVPAQQAKAPVLSAARKAYGLSETRSIDYSTPQFGRFDPALLVQARKRIASAAEIWAALAGGDTGRMKQASDQFAAVAESMQKLHPESSELARALTRTVEATARAGEAPRASVAMEVATSVLYLEAAYEDLDPTETQMAQRCARLAQRLDYVAGGAQPEPLEPWMEELYRRVSDRQTMGSVVDELRVTLAQVETALDQFFRNPQDRAPLHEVPSKLAQMRGVFSVLGLDQASLGARRMRDSVEKFLVDQIQEGATEVFEKLGNSLGAMGFLIDMLSYQRSLAKQLFVYDEVTGEFRPLMGREKAEVEPAVQTVEVPAEVPMAPSGPLAEEPAALDRAVNVPEALAPRVRRPVPVATVKVEEPDEDAEMREIFLDEAREVIQNGLLAVTALDQSPEDLGEQTTLRRAFHTLKGSSRMVGLMEFGEAAWAMEQLVNTWLADQKPASEDLRLLCGESMRQFADWVEDIATGAATPWSALPFRKSADALRVDDQRLALDAPGPAAQAPSALFAATPPVDLAAGAIVEPIAEPDVVATPADVPPEPDQAQLATVEPEPEPLAVPVSVTPAEPPVVAEPVAEDPLVVEAAPAAASAIAPEPVPEPIALEEEPTAMVEPAADAEPQASDAVPAAQVAAPTTETAAAAEAEVAPEAEPEVEVEAQAEVEVGAQVEPAVEVGAIEETAAEDSAFDQVPESMGQPEPTSTQLAQTPAPADEPEAPSEFGATQMFEPVFVDSAQSPAQFQPTRNFEDTKIPPDEVPAPGDAADAGPSAFEGLDLDFGEMGAQVDEPAATPENEVETESGALLAEDGSDALAGEAADRSDFGADADLSPAMDEPVKVIGDLRIGIPLYNVYLNEADEWSRRLLTELSEWALELDQTVRDSTIGLAHGLGGSSATVGFFAVADIARLLEQALQHVQLHRQGLPEHARIFNLAAEEIRRLLHQFAAGFLKEPDPEIAPALRSVLHAEFAPKELTPAASDAAQPLSAPPSDVAAAAPAAPVGAGAAPLIVASDDHSDAVDALDADLFPIFEEEAAELFPKLGAALRQWAAHPGDRAARTEALRVLHTLKGSARLAGAMRLGDMTHRMESAIEALGSEALPTTRIEPMLGRFDDLRSLFDGLRAFVRRVQAPADADTDTPVADIAGPVVVDVATADTTQTVADQRSRGRAPGAARPVRQVGGQSVRVPALLLDRLVNQAGEVIITRSRMDGRVAQMRASLKDLTGNLDRLRDQLREIELQSETQMQSRMAQAKDQARDFDPLEFDRFTRVQELTRIMAESVADVATVQRQLQRSMQGAEDDLIAQARQARELQRDLLRTRMIEFESISERLYGVVRQSAKEIGKQIKLDIEGGSMELDRGVLERMAPAFEHMLRNAVGHGIESPAQREAAGKPATGTITIALRQEGNDVSVVFGDDGGGLDMQRIRAKALDKGLISDDRTMDDGELANLVFAAGFSTAENVTELSGRGIGLDVVRSEVNALGGRIETSSTPGQGTRFKLVVPLTTAVTQVVMLRLGETAIGVPSSLVEIVRRVPAQEVEDAYQSSRFAHSGEQVPFYWSGALLQLSGASTGAPARHMPVVVFRSAGRRIAVHVDEVLGNQEVVVKNLGPQLSRMPGLTGMSVLASGAVVLIYNPVALASVYADLALGLQLASRRKPDQGDGASAATAVAAPVVGPALTPLVMVVDDSITVRRVTQRLLLREGYRVVLANDGLQALERLQEALPAVVLSDIEMPRMDGFDLARNIRGDERMRALPIIMITSRIAEKHREHATELGVDHYLGKPYSEEELLGLIRHYCAVPEDAVSLA